MLAKRGMAAMKTLSELAQQDFLRLAMQQLGTTRDEFASRISVARRTLDKWLLPNESPDFRGMPDIGRAYIREILEWSRKGA
jgi:transcriptional regulator with XRE-family HTH domain